MAFRKEDQGEQNITGSMIKLCERKKHVTNSHQLSVTSGGGGIWLSQNPLKHDTLGIKGVVTTDNKRANEINLKPD